MTEVVRRFKGLIVLILTLFGIFLLYRITLHMLNISSLRFEDLTLHFIALFASVFALILVLIFSKHEV